MGIAVHRPTEHFAADAPIRRTWPKLTVRRWRQMMTIKIGFNAGARPGNRPSARNRAGIASRIHSTSPAPSAR